MDLLIQLTPVERPRSARLYPTPICLDSDRRNTNRFHRPQLVGLHFWSLGNEDRVGYSKRYWLVIALVSGYEFVIALVSCYEFAIALVSGYERKNSQNEQYDAERIFGHSVIEP